MLLKQAYGSLLWTVMHFGLTPEYRAGFDALRSGAKVAKSLTERWEKLIEVVEAGMCLPFVGAGISGRSWDPGDLQFQPSVWHLITLMVRGLSREEAAQLADRGLILDLGDLAKVEQLAREDFSGFAKLMRDGRYVDAVEALRGSKLPGASDAIRKLDFSRIAEVCMWILGDDRLLRTLRAECFTRLLTLPAHRYLARLQREGWVDEIITTNWDTCLERAYRGTFQFERSSTRFFPAVIRSDHEYQGSNEWGSPDSHERSDEPLARLFKINGCAAELVEHGLTSGQRFEAGATGVVAHDGSMTMRISGDVSEVRRRPSLLLTDTQLAQMREDWKRELLRDRLRSKRLLTSGFGADEAQVRYTVTEIVSRLADPERGPFVQEFLEHPTFPQHQLLGAGAGVGLGDLHDRFFGGRDNPVVGEDTTTKLPADTFWRRVYQAAMWRRVDRALQDARSPLRRTIDSETGHTSGGPVVDELRRWLGRPKDQDAAPVSRLFGRRAGLWEELPCPQANRPEPRWPSGAHVDLDHSLLLMALVRAARRGPTFPEHTRVGLPDGGGYRQAEHYRPFRQDQVAIGYAILACCAAWPEAGVTATEFAPAFVQGLVPHEGGLALLWEPRDTRATPVGVDLDNLPSGRVGARMWTLGPVTHDRPLWVRVRRGRPGDSNAPDQGRLRVVVCRPESPAVTLARRLGVPVPAPARRPDLRRARLREVTLG
jgi:hypothetical protein